MTSGPWTQFKAAPPKPGARGPWEDYQAGPVLPPGATVRHEPIGTPGPSGKTMLQGAGNFALGLAKSPLGLISSALSNVPQMQPRELPGSVSARYGLTPQMLVGSNAQLQSEEDALRRWSAPHGTAQRIGKYAGDAGLNLAASTLLPESLPLRMGAEAALNAGLSKSEGGSPWLGAVGGLLQEPAGRLLTAASRPLIRSAFHLPEPANIAAEDSQRAATQELLNEKVPGLTPRRMLRNVGKRVEARSQQLNAMNEEAGRRGVKIPLTEPRALGAEAVANAQGRNSPLGIEHANTLLGQISNEAGTGQPIPEEVTPARARALKQGLDETITGKFENAGTGRARQARALAKRMAGAIDREADTRIPGHGALNQRISGLLRFAESKPPSVGRSLLQHGAMFTGPGAAAYYGTEMTHGDRADALRNAVAASTLFGMLGTPTGRLLLGKGLGALGSKAQSLDDLIGLATLQHGGAGPEARGTMFGTVPLATQAAPQGLAPATEPEGWLRHLVEQELDRVHARAGEPTEESGPLPQAPVINRRPRSH